MSWRCAGGGAEAGGKRTLSQTLPAQGLWFCTGGSPRPFPLWQSLVQYSECSQSLSLLESETLECHEADASLARVCQSSIWMQEPWQTDLLSLVLKSLAPQSSVEAGKLSAAQVPPSCSQTQSKATQGGGGVRKGHVWTLATGPQGLEGACRAGCVSVRREG